MATNRRYDFKPGDVVIAISESYGWGAVSPGDIGIVKSRDRHSYTENMYTVDFLAYKGWHCLDEDLRIASDAEKQAWLIKMAKTPSSVATSSMAGTSSLTFTDLTRGVQSLATTLTTATPAKAAEPKHIKGLKRGSRVKVTQGNNYFADGEIVEVMVIETDPHGSVKCLRPETGDQYWIGKDQITTDFDPMEGKVRFETVILEQHKKDKIIATIKQIDNHELIFKKWGFGDVLEKGKAISMLFYGPPGTGKTLMAQAIADKLDKKLKVIGSAEIESSEPGQAERNLKAFFEGTKNDTVLLFDECDSLVYSREHVGSILAAQVNQLLSSLEAFEGIVIFTTNRLGVLDEAFNRRLSLKLEFGMPTKKQRAEIWKRMMPKKAPLADDVNWQALAEVELSGGYIKNVVLRAARIAAAVDGVKDKDKKITMKHLIDALADEVTSVIEFEEARNNNHLPRMMGGATKTRSSSI